MGMIVFLLLDLFGGAIINRYQMVGSMILLTNLLIAVLIISAKIKEKRCDKNEIIKKLLASLIARATKRMGIAACGCASMYGGYQAKEPKNIYKN